MVLRSERVCRNCEWFSRTRHDSGKWMFSCREGWSFLPARRFEQKPEPTRCLLRDCVVIEEERD